MVDNDRMTMRRRTFLTGLTGLVGAAAASTLFQQAVAAETDGETLRVAISTAPGDLDPHKFKGLYAVQDMVFEPLVTYSYDGKIEPGLAAAWSLEEDGKLLRLTLREGVTFHDGAPFDAAAAKWNLARWMGLPDNNWMNCSRLFVEATVIDDHHIDISFKEPVLGLLQELAYVRPGRFLSPQSVAADGSYQSPIGTGPWVQVSTDNTGSLFERFEGYWGDKPKISKIQLKVLPDSRGRMAALRAGDIDLMGGTFVSPITAIEAQTLQQAGIDVVVEPGSTTMIMAFNPDRAPALKDANVRKAIDIGIDRAAISKVLYRGLAATSANLFAEAVPLSGKRYEIPVLDVEGAKALLDQAGWVGSPVRQKDGVPLALEIVVSEEQIPGSRSVAEVMQAELQEIGIELTIRSVDHASRHSDIPERKFDLAFFQTYGAPYEPFATIVGLFLSTYDNGVDGKLFVDAEHLDPLVVATMSATDTNMEANVQKVYDWLHDNTAIAPLLYVPGIWAHSKRVEGFKGPATEYDMPYENISLGGTE